MAVAEPLPTRFGRHLRALRVMEDLRALDVARRAGINVSQLSHIEAGRRPVTPERAVRILTALATAPQQDTPSGREAPVA